MAEPYQPHVDREMAGGILYYLYRRGRPDILAAIPSVNNSLEEVVIMTVGYLLDKGYIKRVDTRIAITSAGIEALRTKTL